LTFNSNTSSHLRLYRSSFFTFLIGHYNKLPFFLLMYCNIYFSHTQDSVDQKRNIAWNPVEAKTTTAFPFTSMVSRLPNVTQNKIGASTLHCCFSN
jgi:hypothetical protein